MLELIKVHHRKTGLRADGQGERGLPGIGRPEHHDPLAERVQRSHGNAFRSDPNRRSYVPHLKSSIVTARHLRNIGEHLSARRTFVGAQAGQQ